MEDFVVYLLSGLGADEKAFKYLNIRASNIVHVNWVKPEKDESLSDYCTRLIDHTPFDQDKRIVLIGVSFGGIVAQELSKRIVCSKVIIISSIKNCEELPPSLKMLQKAKFYNLIPANFFKAMNALFANYFFSVETPFEARLLNNIIKDVDPHFMKWAIGQMCKWETDVAAENIVHIHGEDDRIFPIENIENVEKVPGGHFMIVNKAKEISSLINAELV